MVSIHPRSNRVFFAVTILVAAVVVVTLAVSQAPANIEVVEQPIEVQAVTPPPRIVEPELPPEPEPVRIRTCQVDPWVGVASGMDLAGSVALLPGGEVLWEVGAESSIVPASVLKIVTARAALRVLGPEFRFTTRVVAGSEPGEVWLVGGGDPTLTRTRAGATTYYTDPARLSDLVGQVVDALGDAPPAEAFARVGVDSSRYNAFPTWNDTWRPNAAALGFVTPVTALMVDGGRLDPSGRLAQRTTDPVGQAGEAFRRQLAEATNFWRSEAVTGVAPSGGRVLADVASPPLSVLLDQMIRDSDNQIAEALIREVAVALNVDSLDDAARYGLPDSSVSPEVFFADDGSGLSHNNVMTATVTTDLLVDLVGDAESQVIIDAFARPGEPGSLQRRFVGWEEAWPDISGKTGSLVGVRSLAGIIDGEDPLVYSVFITGQRVDDQTRDVIDRLVAEFRACGENLAHWVPTEPGE